MIPQLGLPDMKLPIQYALLYPDRKPMPGPKLDLYDLSGITFEKPDMETFKGLGLAFDALKAGGSLPTVYNAANEKAVALFLDHKIRFLDIADLIEKAMAHHKNIADPNVDQILATELETYDYLRTLSE